MNVKSIFIRPIEINHNILSPIRVESLRVSGSDNGGGTIVDTNPKWVVISDSIMSQQCEIIDNAQTGWKITTWSQILEDQNPNSPSYGEQKEEQHTTRQQDLDSCPISMSKTINVTCVDADSENPYFWGSNGRAISGVYLITDLSSSVSYQPYPYGSEPVRIVAEYPYAWYRTFNNRVMVQLESGSGYVGSEISTDMGVTYEEIEPYNVVPTTFGNTYYFTANDCDILRLKLFRK